MQGLAGLRIDHQRAQQIGALLFSKYDYEKKGSITPNQCYQMFADNCYRNLESPPSLDDADSMAQVLDYNMDKRVSQEDLETLAVKYLCSNSMGKSMIAGNMGKSMMGGASSHTVRTTTTTVRASNVS